MKNKSKRQYKISMLWPQICVLRAFNCFFMQRYCLGKNRALCAIFEGVIDFYSGKNSSLSICSGVQGQISGNFNTSIPVSLLACVVLK